MKRQSEYLLKDPGKKFLARATDWVGYALLRPRQGDTIDPAQIRNILLVRLDHIGDLLMTTPAIRALRKVYPTAGIHLLTKSSNREAVELNPYLDQIITFDSPWTIARGKKAGLGEILKTALRLRKAAYDCAIGFRPDLREALLIAATGADFRIGYGERGGGFCFTHPVLFDPGRHEILQALDLLSPLGVDPDGVEMDFFLSPGNRESARCFLAGIDHKPGQKLVGIHPGAASPFKRWEAASFSRLGDLLIREGCRIILFGGPEDRSLLETIAEEMWTEPAAVYPAGVRDLAALIGNLDCLVGNDSAAGHIAQAVGTRAIVLYGPTHDRITGPLDRGKHSVIRHPVPCSPCWLPGTRFHCPHDFRCWKRLTPETAARHIIAVLGRRGSDPLSDNK